MGRGIGSDLAVLVSVAVVVQLAFWYRHDQAAHLVAGGGVFWLLAAVAPRRSAPWIGWAGSLAVLVGAAVHEVLEPAGVDLGDVAFTAAGALLVARGGAEVVTGDRGAHRVALLLGLAAAVVGFGLRYGR